MEPNNCLVSAFVAKNVLLAHAITKSWKKKFKIILLLAQKREHGVKQLSHGVILLAHVISKFWK